VAVRYYEPDCQIVIIDDGVDLNELRSKREWSGALEGCYLLAGKKPFNFARNCNMGIRSAGQRDIVLLNDDALMRSPEGFHVAQKAAEGDLDLGCIGATTNITGQILQKPQNQGLRIIHHIAFVCVFIPRRAINRLKEYQRIHPDTYRQQDGLLDERYCLDYGVEDRDYCEMLTRAGMKVAVHDKCYVDHSRLTSSYRGRPQAAGRSVQNRALFLEKYKLGSYWKWN
jgi:hypothetical protein